MVLNICILPSFFPSQTLRWYDFDGSAISNLLDSFPSPPPYIFGLWIRFLWEIVSNQFHIRPYSSSSSTPSLACYQPPPSPPLTIVCFPFEVSLFTSTYAHLLNLRYLVSSPKVQPSILISCIKYQTLNPPFRISTSQAFHFLNDKRLSWLIYIQSIPWISQYISNKIFMRFFVSMPGSFT